MHGRQGMPWQGLRDPYRVWLSEIMLQQTQVATVRDYYTRFLARFGDVAALAAADEAEVMGLWAGLGYYSRARHLHRCAQQVVTEHGGAFPRSAAQLATLPGIGPSTAAAIAAFCFDERVSILDGNVKRVMTRLLGFGEDLAVPRHERALLAQAQALLPRAAADMPTYTQALMDLGATVCLPREPRCGACPWRAACRAHAQGRPQDYPQRSRRLRRQARASWCLWLTDAQGSVWLQQRPAPGIWAGLWAWPMFDDESACLSLAEALCRDAAAASPEAAPTEVQPLAGFLHVLTHLDWTLHPRRLRLPTGLPAEALEARLGPGRWWRQEQLAALGLPAPLRKRLPLG
ncbi:MAG: A/G-specific adenine glycosylase [Burkholderiaceae bacterium]|nr:A/G-specific adenine glycosylase [Burkholderiaceae bacterium]